MLTGTGTLHLKKQATCTRARILVSNRRALPVAFLSDLALSEAATGTVAPWHGHWQVLIRSGQVYYSAEV